jgi:hypothetical protein
MATPLPNELSWMHPMNLALGERAARSGNFKTPTGTYTVTVTATGGNRIDAAIYTLTVQ